MKNSTRIAEKIEGEKIATGLDLGDKVSYFCVLGPHGEILREDRVGTTPGALRKVFGVADNKGLIALEAGTHSPWVSRLLKELGHEVAVANPARLRLIFDSPFKNDRADARSLARLARMDRELLHEIEHRSEGAQADLAVVRSRDTLVRTRTSLINHIRGAVKSFGARVKGGPTESFLLEAAEAIPPALRGALEPVLQTISGLNATIKRLDEEISRLGRTKYPETRRLQEVHGVGPLISLAFVLTLEDPARFAKSRAVGAFLGLVPRRDQSGSSDPQKRITKRGDSLMRRLLVQSAHRILGRFGPDSDLRRFGLRIASHGGKNGKKRAIIAVARKLAVLLHRLWRSEDAYLPLFASDRAVQPTA